METLKQTVTAKSDQELLAMVYEIDEWSSEMLHLVETELSHRNMLPADLEEKKRLRVEAEDITLSRGKDASLAGTVIGWLTCFGFFGIYMGYHYAHSKTHSRYTDKSYYTYNESTRRQGQILLFVSCVLTAVALLYRFS